MSADNGVYVLQTKGPEYRVAYAQAIDNIYGKFNDDSLHWEANPDAMRQYFGESAVFKTIEEALDVAESISYDYEYLEDGVCVITDFSEVSFDNE